MGCVQSQPSHHSKYHSASKSHHPHSKPKRKSQEFYHQYQPAPHLPNNYQHINHPSTNSSAVIPSNEGQRHRLPSKSNNNRVSNYDEILCLVKYENTLIT